MTPLDQRSHRTVVPTSIIPGSGTCLAFVLATIVLAGCSTSTAVPTPESSQSWTPPEDISGTPVSCDENRSLFAYDRHAPLDTQEISRSREEGVTIIEMTYASPLGGRVPATLIVPDGSGPYAGMLHQHGMPSTRQALIPGAITYARMGAVVLLIDAPFARRENGLEESLSFTERDRREQIQMIVDLRRGIDLLLARPEVDPERLAYVGISHGGAMGGLTGRHACDVSISSLGTPAGRRFLGTDSVGRSCGYETTGVVPAGRSLCAGFRRNARRHPALSAGVVMLEGSTRP